MVISFAWKALRKTIDFIVYDLGGFFLASYVYVKQIKVEERKNISYIILNIILYRHGIWMSTTWDKHLHANCIIDKNNNDAVNYLFFLFYLTITSSLNNEIFHTLKVWKKYFKFQVEFSCCFKLELRTI